MRHQLSPGITYASKSTLSVIGQPVVGRGAQSLGHIKEEASTVKKSNTSSDLSAGEISDRVRRAVSESRIPAADADKWTDLLAEDPSHAELLEAGDDGIGCRRGRPPPGTMARLNGAALKDELANA